MACNTSSDDGTNNSNQENEKNKEENLANDDFPVTLTNAGREISFDAPPERVVALYQQEAEMMAALDLEDKLEGYSIKSANTPEKYEEKLAEDRKSTRLNSSHVAISYAVFCLKKKKTQSTDQF